MVHLFFGPLTTRAGGWSSAQVNPWWFGPAPSKALGSELLSHEVSHSFEIPGLLLYLSRAEELLAVTLNQEHTKPEKSSDFRRAENPASCLEGAIVVMANASSAT